MMSLPYLILKLSEASLNSQSQPMSRDLPGLDHIRTVVLEQTGYCLSIAILNSLSLL